MDPLVLRMETKIEISPLRTLNNENTVFVYKVRAFEVTQSTNKVYEEGRVYLFQNVSDSISQVTFSATGNLFIIKAVINGEVRNNEGPGINVVVRPGEIVELSTVLRISEGDMRQLICSKGGYADEQYPLTTIVITHRDALQQVIPIYINVQDSKLELSVTSLDFGDVLLRDSKVLPVRIRCREGEEKFSCKIVSRYKGVLRVSPNIGEVTQHKSVILDVIFTPKECLSYYGMLVVTTSTDAMNKVVLLFGKGSWNYRNHQRLAP
uniref:Deleted in lung and esophageal cancer protein 1 n=1 Tax=Lygus hesperus TaxID=30085 RepID=A0A0A9WHH6_LYGHE